MAFIDSDGMFSGDRMAMLSDKARWVWPWLWCASNTFGRIELNYEKICDNVFRQFKKRPTEDQFWEWVRDFRSAYLLFVYEFEGQLWGQWDTSEKFLPTYKKTADKNAPQPNAREFLEWKNSYRKRKAALTLAKVSIRTLRESPKTPTSETWIQKDLEILDDQGNSFQQSSLGIGTGIGKGETPLFAAVANEGTLAARPWVEERHDEFYEEFWRHVNRKQSFAAYVRRIKDLSRTMSQEEAAQFLVKMVAQDKTKWEGLEAWSWRQNLHPATWLNGERWNDDPPPLPVRIPTAVETRRSHELQLVNMIGETS